MCNEINGAVRTKSNFVFLFQSSLSTTDLDSSAVEDRREKDRGKEEPESVSRSVDASQRKGVPTISVRPPSCTSSHYLFLPGEDTTSQIFMFLSSIQAPENSQTVTHSDGWESYCYLLQAELLDDDISHWYCFWKLGWKVQTTDTDIDFHFCYKLLWRPFVFRLLQLAVVAEKQILIRHRWGKLKTSEFYLPSGTWQSTAARQALCPDPAQLWSAPSIPIFLLGPNPLPWAPAFTSDPLNAGWTEEPTERPENLHRIAKESAQVCYAYRKRGDRVNGSHAARECVFICSFIYSRQEMKQLTNALDDEKRSRISLQVRLLKKECELYEQWAISHCVCVCLADGSRAHKAEPYEMKSAHPHRCTLIITGQRLKTFSLLAQDSWAKSKFVPNDRHDQHQQQHCNMESATPPSPPPRCRLILCLLLYSPFKDSFLLRLLRSRRSLPCHWYWLNNRAAATVVTSLVRLVSTCEGNLNFVARLVQTVLFCAHSAAFASYRCVSLFLLSINVRTGLIDLRSRDILVKQDCFALSPLDWV